MLRASGFAKNAECNGNAHLQRTPKPMMRINPSPNPGCSMLTNTNKKSRKSIKMELNNRSDLRVSYHTSDSKINEAKEEIHTDSGISSMDIEKEEYKENSRRKSKLVRQHATDTSPVVTRSCRKSMNTTQVGEVATPRRSSRKKILHVSEEDVVVEEKTVGLKERSRSSLNPLFCFLLKRRKSGLNPQN